MALDSSHVRYPLDDPKHHRDACGVGFLASRSGERSHSLLQLGVACLERLDHRGAKAADGTGDGAGILTQIPYRILERDLSRAGRAVPSEDRLGVLMVFLPRGNGQKAARTIVEEAVGFEHINPLMWRPVPVDPKILGTRAKATRPRIEQLIVEAPAGIEDPEDFERLLYLARRRIERVTEATGLEGLSVSSASGRTVVYKGLYTAATISNFYWDLRDPTFETSFAVFHQRYSTNTAPAWEMAQPFRTLAHNGEINTVKSNRAWMAAREVNPTSPVFGDRSRDLVPFLQSQQSDSGSLDNVFELLVRGGRSIEHAKEMLVPAAWENVANMDPELRSFYEYHAFLTEAWDGPAAIVGTDGVSIVAGLDRNGLRPARWTISRDHVLVASEAGVCPPVEAVAIETGQLGPGEALLFHGEGGDISFSDDINRRLASQKPYGEWISKDTLYVEHSFNAKPPPNVDVAALARVYGYTSEERRLILSPMAEGRSPIGSMGTDTPLAALSATPRRLTHYFHQSFAQVTNPPMDPIREKMVMSLRTYLGSNGSLLEENEQQADKIEISSPILSTSELRKIISIDDERFRSRSLSTVWPVADGPEGMIARLALVADQAVEAVRDGISVLVLSDAEVDAEHAPIPILLAVSTVHHRLISEGLRIKCSMLVVSGEPRDAHDLACLIGFGASAVNPYMAIEEVRRLAQSDAVAVDPVIAQENYRSAARNGLLKIMSKMGICTVKAYRGGELFEMIGLDEETQVTAFRYAELRLGGVGMNHVAEQTLALHANYAEGSEPVGGFFKYRRGGEEHVTSPGVVLRLQRAVRSGVPGDWSAYLEAVNDRAPVQLRDLLTFVPREPIALDEVEPVAAITSRFVGAAMSLGALSKESHEALAEAMHRIGGLSNSGEGGEDPERFGTIRNSPIKQVASGRFGVNPGYLASAEELQIKMAQGSKPGEGGQLPGHKVTREIAELRHTVPGTTLISPPPHHDIYSIEDLAQLIFDLKAFKPSVRVGVKLVSEPGVGTVAVGVAKAQADVITISGMDGGTGASPLVSIKHAGAPWELGLAEAHQVLLSNGLRSRVTLETDGGLRTGRDVVVAALLGAERFGFGTLPLLALGCKMVRQCHENTCPVGIATQREDLRAKFTGTADQVVALFTLVAEEVRQTLAALGAKSLSEIIGRADLFTPLDPDHPVAKRLDRLLVRAEGQRRHPGYVRARRSELSEKLVDESRDAIADGRHLELSYPITNEDRSIGATVSGEIARLYGNEGLPEGTIKLMFAGTSGQSFGAWLSAGMELRLDGAANDYVGKGMGGGTIAIVPSVLGDTTPQGAGNALMYGATGGALTVSGRVGQRFAVRNSGGLGIVEGCSDHGCEYMTGGKVVILGPFGHNFGSGMTGGVAYVFDPMDVLPEHVAEGAPSPRLLQTSDHAELLPMLEYHVAQTGSVTGIGMLERWPEIARDFRVLRP